MAKTPDRIKAITPAKRPPLVHQFLIVLNGTDPLVWRRLHVPDTNSFWDLHVAIQDAMGWQDCHLHEFRLLDPGEKRLLSIGLPTNGTPRDRPVVLGWKEALSDYFPSRSWHALPTLYAYDFGDNWEHVVVHEGMEPAEPALKYPRCLGGARRCPPEDCGGVHGYADFLKIIINRKHREHASLLEWAGGSYDPDAFDPQDVVFEDPFKRWKTAFGR